MLINLKVHGTVRKFDNPVNEIISKVTLHIKGYIILFFRKNRARTTKQNKTNTNFD